MEPIADEATLQPSTHEDLFL